MNIQPSNYAMSYSTPIAAKKNVNNNSNASFQGKKDGPIKKLFTETYGKTMLNSTAVRNLAKKIESWDKKDASRHFQVAGSAVTSAAYMNATLKNKEFDKNNAVTLAVNQGLCFVIPTIAAYTADAGMADFNKKLEYSYAAAQERKMALNKLTPKQKELAVEKLRKSLKGVRVLMTIVTFTAIYRYLSPVLITPLANWIGNMINKPKTAETPKKEIKMEIETNEPEAKIAA